MDAHALRRRIRIWLVVFIVGLVLSGLTAFPLVTEVRWAHEVLLAEGSPVPKHFPAVAEWLGRIHRALQATDARHPFLLYGTDWLAFAHLVIAVAFYGPYRDPVRNIWVVEFGMIACVGVIPLALICGTVRGIPFFWQVIDMSFGVFGIVPLLFLRRLIKRLEAYEPFGSTTTSSGSKQTPTLSPASGA